jgi:hypothetical protein
VYALLGLVDEYARDRRGLVPAYDDAQPAAAAFVRAAVQILEDGGGDLLLLSCVEGERHQREATGPLPSWVPDWSAEEPTGLRVTGYQRYCAAGELEQRVAIDREAQTLELVGMRLDRVTMVGETKQAVLRGEAFPGWLEIAESLEATYRHGSAAEHKVDVFWRTLIVDTAGYPPRLVGEHNNRALGASFATWFRETTARAVASYQDNQQKDENSAWRALIRRFERLLDERFDAQGFEAMSASEYGTPFSLSQHLRLFRTAEGYLGMGSECVQVGDLVCIVPGSRVPLLLRRAPHGAEGVEPGRGRHRLVGGAYVHGVMAGESISLLATGLDVEGIQNLMEIFILE